MMGDDGKLIDIKDFLKILENKSNWLCEYGIIKYTLQPFIKKYNLSNAQSTNIHDNTSFQFYTEFSNRKKCNFFYNNLIIKKFQKPCNQTYLSKELHIDS